MINSFDVFDTVIGRLCYKGTNIFEILGKTFFLENFKNNRINFEDITKNFDETYVLLENLYGKNMDLVKKKELELEYELSFPIIKYMNMVENNDIFISDMYLSKEEIKSLLNKHKKIENKIYVSYGDKKNNIVWKNKTITFNIKSHYGDNYHSDYLNPTNNGINSVYISDTLLTNFETELLNINENLSML
jgi:predicted HAD superfamily hydrolase